MKDMYPSLPIKLAFGSVFALAILGLATSFFWRNSSLGLPSLTLLLSACFFALLCRKHKSDLEEIAQARLAQESQAQKAVQRLRETQHSVTRVLAEAASVQEGMPQVLQAICQSLGWQIGIWWIPDGESGQLRCQDSWNSSPDALFPFVESSYKLTLGKGEGLPGTVWSNKEPVWLADASASTNFPRVQAAAEAGLHTACAFPILRGEIVLGVMEFFNPVIQPPDQETLAMFATIGSQLGLFIERKQTLEALLEHVHLADFVADISSRLTQNDSLQDILHNCCQCIVDYLEAAFARIWTLNKEDNVLELQASAGMYTHIDGPHSRVPVGTLKIGLIAQEQKAHLTNSVLTDERVGDKEWAKREGMVSFAGHPLMLEGEVVGVIALFARKELSQATLSALSAIANSVAQAIKRKRSEETLILNQSRQACILNCMNEAVIVADRQGRLLLSNQAAQRMHGVKGYLPPPETWAETFGLYLPDMKTRYLPGEDPLALAIRGEPVKVTELYIHPPGSEIEMWITATASPLLDTSGQLIGGLVVSRDVTERKAAERRVAEFYSTVSHELRTPLTSIRASLGLIEGGMTEELQPVAMELVEIARSECDRLIRLVNDILDMKKIEAGRLELVISSLDPEQLVGRAMEALQGFANESNIALISEVTTRQLVRGDKDRILQVLTNLVSNAVKFSLPGNRVRIRVEPAAERRLRFSVIDRGTGIAGKDIGKLFTQFLQLDASDTRSKGGTGLGLSIAKSIIDSHGGEIGVESEPGQGSTFWFELPVVSQRVCETVEPGAPRVLIVDDDPSTRAVIAKMLSELKVELLEAENGEQSLSLSRSADPDLIILDLIMPGLSGFDVVERLREGKSRHVPLLVYSAHEASAAERERLRLGTTKYLTKARCSEAEFMDTVRDLLDGLLSDPSTLAVSANVQSESS